MFSGIIEELGKIRNISKRGNILLLEIEANTILEDTQIGQSIAVDGVCLTIVKKDKNCLSFEVMPETLKITTLGSLRISDKVNLERSLKIGDRLCGHFVSGHIHCTGIIYKKGYLNDNLYFQIGVPVEVMAHITLRGSLAVDGISLTVAGKRSNTFTVNIIPHTFKNTTLGFKGSSDKVNVEFDLLRKF